MFVFVHRNVPITCLQQQQQPLMKMYMQIGLAAAVCLTCLPLSDLAISLGEVEAFIMVLCLSNVGCGDSSLN